MSDVGPRPAGSAPRAAGGFTTVQYVAACGLSLVLLVLVANLLVALYARGALRHALDEGVRAGVRIDAGPDACEQRAHDAARGLLRGPIGNGVDLECRVGPSEVVATATLTVRSWLPALVPDWRLRERAVAARAE